jgi:uncharacterized protein
MILPISLTAAAAAGLINLWLGIRIGQVRVREKVNVGDGGNEAVLRRMRAQANFVEFTPFVLILIVLLELATGTSTWLWVVSSLYALARIAHAFGMEKDSKLRGIGIMITMLVMAGLSLYAAYVAQSSDGTITEATVADAAEIVPVN